MQVCASSRKSYTKYLAPRPNRSYSEVNTILLWKFWFSVAAITKYSYIKTTKKHKTQKEKEKKKLDHNITLKLVRLGNKHMQ